MSLVIGAIASNVLARTALKHGFAILVTGCQPFTAFGGS